MIPAPDNEPETEQRIRRYVLGELTSPELEDVEGRLLSDEAFFEQVEAVEAEVCDDFVAGRLSAAEGSAFASRLTDIGNDNPRLQRRVAFARALGAAKMTPAVSKNVKTNPEVFTWALAAAVILATAGVVWFARDRPEPSSTVASGPTPGVGTPTPGPSPGPVAGQPPVTPAPPVVLATLTLFGPVVRDAAQMPVLSIPAGQGLVRVEIALQDGDVFPGYRANVTTQSGSPVLTKDRLLPSTSPSGRTVVIDLAADRLPNGTYDIALNGVRGTDATRLVTYAFRVTR